MAPIVRVETPDGEVVHDCADARCDVSWDGKKLTRKGGKTPTGTTRVLKERVEARPETR